MTKIFFFSPTGFAPLQYADLRRVLHTSHGWRLDGEKWVYGVAIPKPTVCPHEVADRLAALGVYVLPGVHDTDAKPHTDVVKALERFGVTAGHSGKQIAQRMSEVSGMPVLRPHFW